MTCSYAQLWAHSGEIEGVLMGGDVVSFGRG